MMHKLTTNRMTWGWAAFLSGTLLLAVVLLLRANVRHQRPHATEGSHSLATAPVPTYGVKQHWLTMDSSRISVYDRRTGLTVWSCGVRQFEGAEWSADRRSLVVMDWWIEAVKLPSGEPSSTYRWRFQVWTEGEPVRVVQLLPDIDGANTVDLSWSPDRQRWLLLVTNGIGDADMERYSLWSVRLRDRRVERVTDGVVSQAEWVGTRRIRYRVTGNVYDPKSDRFLPVPETIHERDCQ